MKHITTKYEYNIDDGTGSIASELRSLPGAILVGRVMRALCVHMSFHNSPSHAGVFISDEPFILVKSGTRPTSRWSRVKDLEIIVG